MTSEAAEIHVDRTKCCGYGICTETAPLLFRLDDMGFAHAEAGELSGPAVKEAAEAAEACPERAITLLFALSDGK
ncbi:ferredoxin [Streptomyces sp. bgisy027]|uniref:ferredoxin n=1 Tax=Streptomyces sp. bgisy027 TaxID=3413770 RepID=UPI003D70B3B5